ncbi:Hpt domain-containing protein [Burkholderia territorii]|uniref:Hpt domain-containing response regulator n=1 Tax=Burkholderia territorii TaxID=1503055 RepID=UPI00075891A4|nr:Hpt domain-containing protein [Burkholderia territorii]KUZ59186.1 hypothetical protein WS53_07655 [Burkholderia territorii]
MECGEQALVKLSSSHFDVVLTDVGLPDMDGRALADWIRERHAGLPVVTMTAHANVDDEAHAVTVRIPALLRKPVTLGMLRRALHTDAVVPTVIETTEQGPVDRHSVPEMMLVMQRVTLNSLASIDRALIDHDATAVVREFHFLSGGFLSVGNDVLSELFTGLQQLIRDEGGASVAELRPALRDEIVVSLDRLSAVP